MSESKPPHPLAVASPGDILTAVRSREAIERFWSMPEDPQGYRLLGRRLGWIPELRSASLTEPPTVLGMMDAARDLLSEIGIEVEIIRAKQDCVVLKCRVRGDVPATPAFEFTKGMVETLPKVVNGVEGTIVESPTSKPSLDVSLFTLVWQPELAQSASNGSPTKDLARVRRPRTALTRGNAELVKSTTVGATVVTATQHATSNGKLAPAVRSAPLPLGPVTIAPPPLETSPEADSSADELLALPTAYLGGADAQDEGPRRVTGLRDRVPWLFRRAWVFIACVVLVMATTMVVSAKRTVTYGADSILLVNPGASAISPGSAVEAGTLAATYAGLIPADNAIIRYVASKTGLSFRQVQSDLGVTVENGTSLLDVNFTSASPSTSLIGANATAIAISGTSPVTPAIPAGTTVITKQATSATKHSTSSGIVLGLGAILGILLGSILVLAWERADPRFDRPAQVTEVLGLPTRLASELSDASIIAILRQWQSEPEAQPPRVAFLAGIPAISEPLGSLAARFAAAGQRWGISVMVRTPESLQQQPEPSGKAGSTQSNRAKSPVPQAGTDVELLVGGMPGVEGGEVIAQQAGITVLVFSREAKVRTVQRSAKVLGELGSTPSWALLTESRAPSPLRRLVRSLRRQDPHEGQEAPAE
jgi:capsular polysaccharide biosynthesis protein